MLRRSFLKTCAGSLVCANSVNLASSINFEQKIDLSPYKYVLINQARGVGKTQFLVDYLIKHKEGMVISPSFRNSKIICNKVAQDTDGIIYYNTSKVELKGRDVNICFYQLKLISYEVVAITIFVLIMSNRFL